MGLGRLVYLTHTRPEISYGVNILPQIMQTPRSGHWVAALRLARYLRRSRGQVVLLSSAKPSSHRI